MFLSGKRQKKPDRQLRKNSFVKLQYPMGICGKAVSENGTVPTRKNESFAVFRPGL
jgi:hypothetical protein